MTYKVLITTSGVGQRLGELTKYTNKSLVRVGVKPAIAHIIEAYPKDTRFVVTLGYFGDQVRDFISLAYPHAHVEYREVEEYQGPGTSLGLSMLAAKDALQCPFIYHACDTLVAGDIPAPKRNWVGVYKGDDTSQYASWTLQEGRLQFQDKGAIEADFLHIGLVGINDHDLFWETLERLYRADPDNGSLNDCAVLDQMIGAGKSMDVVEFPTWRDIGNVASLAFARKEAGASPDDLDKSGETVFIFEDFVIKFFSDKAIVRNRATRGAQLNGFVPDMQGVAGNFYRYAFVPGELYSHVVQPEDFRQFLAWAQRKFWRDEREVDQKRFSDVCRTFYHDKTQKRVAQFLEAASLEDTEHIINGERVPTAREMLERIDFEVLSEGMQSRFHGDFILDNILRTSDGYCLLDWRQDFGGLLRGGDRYYDLAKLNHNLTVNHRVVNNNLFVLESDGAHVHCEIMRPSTLVECQDVFFDFLHAEGYDARKVEVLTALVWLNMAPLHHHPFNLFLYYFGKLHLWRAIQKD